MNEGRPQKPETGLETVPTPEEIKDVFEKLTRSGRYTEIRRLEDEKGIYVWIISMETEDGTTEYEYNRSVIDPPHAPKTAVFATTYDKDGMPTGGSTIAQLINHKWNTNLIDVRTWLPKG